MNARISGVVVTAVIYMLPGLSLRTVMRQIMVKAAQKSIIRYTPGSVFPSADSFHMRFFDSQPPW